MEPRTSRFQAAPRRKVEATILTDLGWLQCSIMLPKLNALVDYLNATDGYLKLTNVVLPGKRQLDFLALSQQSYSVIIPADGDQRVSSNRVGTSRKHSVSCILAGGWISGLLSTNSMIRLSDFLTPANRYFLLSDCTFGNGAPHAPVPFAVVNGARIIGISEPSLENAQRSALATAG